MPSSTKMKSNTIISSSSQLFRRPIFLDHVLTTRKGTEEVDDAGFRRDLRIGRRNFEETGSWCSCRGTLIYWTAKT